MDLVVALKGDPGDHQIHESRKAFVESFNVGRDMVVRSMVKKMGTKDDSEDPDSSAPFSTCKSENVAARLVAKVVVRRVFL